MKPCQVVRLSALRSRHRKWTQQAIATFNRQPSTQVHLIDVSRGDSFSNRLDAVTIPLTVEAPMGSTNRCGRRIAHFLDLDRWLRIDKKPTGRRTVLALTKWHSPGQTRSLFVSDPSDRPRCTIVGPPTRPQCRQSMAKFRPVIALAAALFEHPTAGTVCENPLAAPVTAPGPPSVPEKLHPYPAHRTSTLTSKSSVRDAIRRPAPDRRA